MVTRKSRKSASRAVQDEEVKTLYHDEVLNWLIDSLDVVVAASWGLNEADLSRCLDEARSSAKQWVSDDVCRSLKEFASGDRQPRERRFFDEDDEIISIGEPTRRLLKNAAGRTKDVISLVSTFAPDAGIGDASLETYEVMKPVFKIEARTNVDDKIIEAGYVDLAAKIFVPEKLEFVINGVEREYSHFEHISNARKDEDFRKIAEAFDPGNVKLSVRGQRHSLWFSVRTSSFTLGEILQELKALSALEDKKQVVSLVVDSIDPKMREKIEREGFAVVSRGDFLN